MRVLVSEGSGAKMSLTLIERTMSETLPSWHCGTAKHLIIDFVVRVCREGSPKFGAPPARIAMFDNE